MFDRSQAIAVRNLISSFNPGTRYEVVDGGQNLRITVKGGLLPEQRELARTHKNALIELFTTPPEVDPQCYHGNASKWELNENGVWICPHSSLCQPSQKRGDNPPAASKSVLAKYWLERAS